MFVDLKKDYRFDAPEGQKTIWDKELFQIEIFVANISPTTKNLSLSFRFVNKVNGLISTPPGVQTTVNFDRVIKERVKNGAEINNLNDRKERISRLITATEQMNSQLEGYKNNSGLADDEKLKVDSDINDNLALIKKEKEKLALIVVPAQVIEKSEDFDFIVREYMSGLDFNDKGKKWAEKLINDTLSL